MGFYNRNFSKRTRPVRRKLSYMESEIQKYDYRASRELTYVSDILGYEVDQRFLSLNRRHWSDYAETMILKKMFKRQS
jgi:hypothetical protein